MKKTLNIRNFPKELHANLKAQAAILQIPLRELIIRILQDYVMQKPQKD